MKLITLGCWLGLCGFVLPVNAQQWSPTIAPEESWVSIAASADGAKLVAAASPYEGGLIYLSTNYGAAWATSSAPLTNWISVASSADGTKLVAAATGGVRGEPGPIYTSANSGTTWTQRSAPILTWYGVASSADGNVLVAAARWKSIYVSTNAGATWSVTTAPDDFWQSIACSADGTIFIAGTAGGNVFTSKNQGMSWEAANLPRDYWLSVCISADGSHLGAVAPPSGADSGRVCISTNFGQSWKTNIITLDWSAVACSADGSRFVAGAGGFDLSSRRVYTFVNSDESSVTMGDSLLSCRSLASSADGTRWVMAAGKIYTFVTEPTFPSATTLPAQAVRSDATLNAAVNPNGAETTAWFEWGTGTNYGHVTPSLSVGDGWTNILVTTTISGLTPNVPYHCRVIATNALGVMAGWEVPFWSPRIQLIGDSVVTNECHTQFSDAGAVAYDVPPHPPLAISAGAYHSLALLTNGSVIGWGLNSFGQATPPASATNVAAISAGGYQSMALRADNSVVTWGYYNGGQVISETETDIVAIAAGYSFDMALKADGTVVGWGEYYYGKLQPFFVPDDATNIEAIAAGYAHSLALKSDGSVIGWGDNSYGQISIPSNAVKVVGISAGAAHSVALKSDGTVIAWGSDGMGQLDIPADATNIVAISAGGLHSMALRADGRLFVWGWGAAGQTNLPGDASDVSDISAGYYDCLAKTRVGQVIGWGRNLEGEVSIPEAVNADSLPVVVDGYVDANSPGNYTLTYTATNSVGGSDSVVRTIVVEDRTPPMFISPSNLVIDCTTEAGAPLSYLPAAQDLCSGDLPVSSVPSQGSILPIGSNQVNYTATDNAGNVAMTNLQITVLGPRRVALDVLQQMEVQNVTLPPNRAKGLRNAISQMNGLMVDDLWLGETNLGLLSGQKVFRKMEYVSQRLLIQDASRKGDVSKIMLEDWIHRLVNTARVLATVKINEARQNGATTSQLDRATENLDEGDLESSQLRYYRALQKYGDAWESAVRLLRKELNT